MMAVKAEARLRIAQIDTSEMLRRVDACLDEVADQIKEDLDSVVSDWKNKPEFIKVGPEWTDDGGRTLDVIPTPDEEATQIFIWVDQGTKGPYPIRAKNAPYLVFRVPGAPKTLPMPRMVGGLPPMRERTPAGEEGGAHFVRVKEVMHPGVEARRFVDYVVARVKTMFKRRIAEAMEKTPYYYDESGRGSPWRSRRTGQFVKVYKHH